MKPLNKWRDGAEYLTVHGYSIATWRSKRIDDAKPWLLLIHGFPTSSWDWTAIWPALENQFNIACMDMLGFGLSDKPTNIDYRLIAQADFQEALLSELGVSEAHILAHDYGVSVAQELLARHNERSLSFSIKSVCFLNGGIFPELHRPLLIQTLLLTPLGGLIDRMLTKSSLQRSFDKIFGENTKASTAEIDGHWALLAQNNGTRVFHKLIHYIPERRANRDRWVGALEQAGVPIGMINGGQDPISGAHMYDHFRQLFPAAAAVLLPTIGHYPQTEAPDAVATAFFDFHTSIGASV